MVNNMNKPKEFLVEIRVKDWIFIPENESRTVAYEHVVGCADEYYARHIGFDQFYAKFCSNTDEKLKKFFEQGFTSRDFCAPDAVEI